MIRPGRFSSVIILFLVDISPRNVRVSEDNEELTFYWKEPPYSRLFIPTGYKILKSVVGGNWEVASDQIMAEERHYTITSEPLERCEYKVVALYRDRVSTGKEPRIQNKGIEKVIIPY